MTFTPPSDDEFDYTDMARVADRLLTPVVVVAPDSTLRYANNAAARLVDSNARGLVGLRMLDFVHPEDRERVARELALITKERPTGGFTQYRLRGSKKTGWRVIDSYAHNLIDDPDIRGILVSGGDVTEQENLTVALRALTKGNHVLMHATEESSLVSRICDSIVDSGRYMLAWVGYLEHDEAQSVRLVASSGLTKYMDDVHVSWGDNEYGRGPTGEAVRTGSMQVLKDCRRSKRCLPWNKIITDYGVRSACSFPLIVHGSVIGALSIYSRDSETFGPDELELLNDLADNLSFGIGRLRDADRLERNEAHLREAERLAHVGHWELNLATQRVEFMADEIFNLYGLSSVQWQGDVEEFVSFVPETERASVRATLERSVTEGSAELVHRITRTNGEERLIHMRTEAVVDRDGQPERIVGISLDITAQIAAKQELDDSRQFLLAITDNMAEGMIATDDAGVITFANAAAARLVNLTTAEMIGAETKSIFRFKSVEKHSPDADESPLDAVWARGQSLNVEYDAIVRPDGKSIPVAYIASPLLTNGLKGAVIVFEDISERAAEKLRVERELEKLAWVGRIRDALDSGRFALYSQPIVDLETYEIIQNELLIRMIGPSGEVVMPDEFLPTAEEYGLIAEIDRWVIGETARLAALGHRVEFNLSAKSVMDPRTLTNIRNAIETSGALAEYMVCEITETALVRDLAAAGAFVRGLNAIGCKVALDDFGAGWGGFAYLKHLPVSYLKIDREFVRDICEETSSQFVVAAVVNLARAFGMQTVAEGAESDAALRLLKELGVDHAQGFAIGRPMPASDILGD
ncbi:MAG TPA: EAL domain-containing protein [Acidimicrobiales bacterium]